MRPGITSIGGGAANSTAAAGMVILAGVAVFLAGGGAEAVWGWFPEHEPIRRVAAVLCAALFACGILAVVSLRAFVLVLAVAVAGVFATLCGIGWARFLGFAPFGMSPLGAPVIGAGALVAALGAIALTWCREPRGDAVDLLGASCTPTERRNASAYFVAVFVFIVPGAYFGIPMPERAVANHGEAAYPVRSATPG